MKGMLLAAWLDVRSSPMRSLAAMAGMIAAVTTLVLVDAASILSQRANDEYMAHTYGRPATFSVSLTNPPSPSVERALADELTTLLGASGISRLSMDVPVGMVLVQQGAPWPVNGRWVSSTYFETTILDLVAGSFPAQTAKSDTLHAVISTELANQMGYAGPELVGQTIDYIVTGNDRVDLRTAASQRLVVDAVAKPSEIAFGSTPILLVSDLNRPDLLGSFFHRAFRISVNLIDASIVPELVEKIRDPQTGAPAFSVFRVDQADQLAPILNQQRVTARIVTLVALAIGGLGILSTGLASTRERSAEFGLRRALGASKAKIFGGVVVQTMIEVILASAIAVLVAWIVLDSFSRQLVLAQLPLPASRDLPASSVARGIVLALIVGVVAALLPAARAARLSVVQALRG